ncbi:MAG: hypothetical protein A2268_14310 [Candidatus Raymondbacteria bacterium RifOxyA12_full_50_37]|uniref:HTH merR-type domain-containing protein n=1 Tax=Candidatus Raymondbacteria bacterium RIFOXYD12_FULL_49_13 TaxID=1817890 RepID=A0A1F7FKY5_UNCRA|nr:MAG: hypothetical protein A2268_14310 [Candidatus Raymondbacteria bacterium RifOxyA12_full_50_37]OGJ86932.1 MAG: hypothetical protein A2350_02225 [Candidatus Raymondbacteria bacterium RifOxyB12_full_50_8]OGJ88253.1 MAG: hypothetical protein A2248_19650 [Candidatus Raymondbacteria bacterium RIFOXYA2_FULL_49_16]OGK05755.1 MAG: hypothetical protein A2487_19620 [Candidatus Raymondbacteria bacterium RifOxyC12_full_50_8]OGK07298.1 MAG: hypothetical protein A2519_14320 [Candidatus Raymondbacteria b
MEKYLTTGQVAKNLRVSISTVKRWIGSEKILSDRVNNSNGWRLFTEKDLEKLKVYKREKRRNGKKFNSHTLTPVGRG